MRLSLGERRHFQMRRQNRFYNFFFMALATTLMVLPTIYTQSAQAQGYYNPHPDRTHTQEFQVNQRFTGNSSIDLVRLANLNSSQWRDYELVAVNVTARAQRPRGTFATHADIALEINGRQMDYPTTLELRGSTVELTPDRTFRLGQRNQDIELSLRGYVFVDSVEVVLKAPTPRYPDPRPGPSPGPDYETVRESVYRSIGANQRFSVDRQLELSRSYRGDVLMNVAINVTADVFGNPFPPRRPGNTQARLLINGSPVGGFQNVPNSTTPERVLFRLPPSSSRVIGRDIRSVEIEFSGNVFITNVEALVSKQSYNPGPTPRPTPRPDREFSQRLEFRNVGHAEMKMTELAQMDFQTQRRNLRELSVEARGKGRSEIRVCELGRFDRLVNCQRPISLRNNFEQHQFDLSSFGRISAQNIVFVMDGAVEITMISAKF